MWHTVFVVSAQMLLQIEEIEAGFHRNILLVLY